MRLAYSSAIKAATFRARLVCLMTHSDILEAIDIHRLLDRLERVGTIQDYYKLNHITPEQRRRIVERLAEALVPELQSIGIRIDL